MLTTGFLDRSNVRTGKRADGHTVDIFSFASVLSIGMRVGSVEDMPIVCLQTMCVCVLCVCYTCVSVFHVSVCVCLWCMCVSDVYVCV